MLVRPVYPLRRFGVPAHRGHGLTVKETAFKVLPSHELVEAAPIPPETKVVPPSGGLTTKTAAPDL